MTQPDSPTPDTGTDIDLGSSPQSGSDANPADIGPSDAWARRFSQDLRTLKESGMVHASWYLETFPDVGMLEMDPVEHYLRFGACMGRNPGKGFDTDFYLAANADVRSNGINPLLHYLRHGRQEGREPRPPGPLGGIGPAEIHVMRTKMWGGLGEVAATWLELATRNREVSDTTRFQACYHLASWRHYQGDMDGARALLDQIGEMAPRYALSAHRLVRQALIDMQDGRTELARAALASVQEKDRKSDILLATANLDSGAAKLATINPIFEAHGLVPLRLIDPAAPAALANLTTGPVPEAAVDHGKISVVMPAYESQDTIETALRALLRQSYRNIEIVVVDDCSPDGTWAVIERLAAQDSRIVPVRQEENAGAYPARNRGLTVATGDFITTHDADDWSHPQKLETQVNALAADPDLAGVIAHWARARPDLTLTTNWRLMSTIIHWSHSSFMFRRAVLDRVGNWDSVRVSADTEFIWRIETAYGKPAIRYLLRQVPLSFALDDETSLTRTRLTHVSTTYYGLRHYYREICRHWHETRPHGLDDAEQAQRRAMIPEEMFARVQGPVALDLWLRGDCGNPDVLDRMRAVIDARGPQVRIGLTHVPDPAFMGNYVYAAIFPPAFFDLLKQDTVRIAVPGREVEADEQIDIIGTA